MTKLSDNIVYGRTALREHVPWIVPESLDLLNSIIDPEWQVFEWGSGGSTVYWSLHCKLVVSIEHNSDWVKRTTQMLKKHTLRENWVVHYVPGDGSGVPAAFHKYADVIKRFNKLELFDLIYVDGEASCRARCMDNAIPYLKPGGWLLLDNSDWLKREMVGWERHDFVAKDLRWVGQPGTFNWHTALLRKPL